MAILDPTANMMALMLRYTSYAGGLSARALNLCGGDRDTISAGTALTNPKALVTPSQTAATAYSTITLLIFTTASRWVRA